MLKIWITVCAIAAIFSHVLGNPVSTKKEGLTLRILHTNDMHSRFEETSKLSTVCSKNDAKAGKCYGGFARIATLVREARKSPTPCIFLNAGDTYQGSIWYNVYKWKVVTKFLNILAPNVTSLGNHEFDDGVEGLIPFIENATFPIVTSNLDLSKQPNLAATKLLNSTVLTVDNTKIGVIGYLTQETKFIARSEEVIFLDEVESIRREAKALKQQGVDILIALGHSGFEVDKRIGREVEDIDLVIGGHTNTFLYNGKQPDVEVPEGLYPTVVTQKSGRKVYVVQAYAYTKYVGNFTVTFDTEGEVTNIKGNPILVDNSIEQAKDILDELEQMRGAIDNISLTVVGKTRVLLEGDSKVCRREECNLGNLITDAMIDYNAGEYAGRDGWTDAAIAFHNGGSIRTSITRANDDKITMGDVLSVIPFHNAIMKVSMTGDLILSVLEWSVQNLEMNVTANLFGAFAQFSGLQVQYDLSKPKNSRVISVQVQCADCNVPMYSKLERNKTYNALLLDFMQSGGDGYTMLKDLKAQPLGVTTAETLAEYLKKHSPVHPGVEWRISYVNANVNENENEQNKSSGCISMYQSLNLTVLLSLISWLFIR
nr:PREDICTED: protein 5NUC-like [Megachile rotundata]XP_012139775.1 PREDICTED: protein 5NUC-like [Megachile rotundata]XP_012139776.1 PREDICTED: protein 5NUC-like [Megachile rotundata]XP_012139777.1 PREDICTED: protein 5NUC-like [Megachile rotundata]XP_012139778.1 PREDICTED: protein 5NUC-like [Megachile rotundata]XP_012139779.1 PREDICTED: protein 5NUC-like [Megachile rotundata]